MPCVYTSYLSSLESGRVILRIDGVYPDLNIMTHVLLVSIIAH